MSLEQCILIGLKRSLKKDLALLETEKAKINVQKAQSAFLPSIKIEESFTRLNRPLYSRIAPGELQYKTNLTLPTTPIPAEYSNISIENLESLQIRQTGKQIWKIDVEFKQPVFAGGRIFNTYGKAKLGVELADINYYDVQSELVYRIKEAYVGIIFAEEKARLSEELKTRFKALLEMIESSYKSGRSSISKVDYLRALSFYRGSSDSALKASQELTDAKLSLKYLLGLEDDFEIENDSLEGASASLTSKDREGAIARVLSLAEGINNENFSSPGYEATIKYKLAKQFSLMAEKDAKISLGELLPSIFVFGREELLDKYYKYGTGDRNSWAVGVAFTYDIFDGGLNYQKYREAKNDLQKKQLEEKMALKSIRESKERLDSNINSLANFIENSRATCISLADYRQSCEEGYKADAVDINELLKSYIAEFEIKVNHRQVMYSYCVLVAQRDALMSGYERVAKK